MAVQSDKQFAAADAAAPAADAPRSTVRYIDKPDVNETFADTISSIGFDGQTLRIEFAVSRVDQSSQNNQVSRSIYPAARLVLTPGAAADLIRKLQQVAAAQLRAQKPESPQQ